MSLNIALYRKYRPNNFSEIIGQDLVVKTLKNSIKDNKINHAYIFAGSRGIGKTSIAKIFAKTINCLNLINGDCCNQCKNCLIINSNLTMDIIEIDAASNNGVDEVRNIINNINYLPIELKYKVYVIDEAHMLTNGAWNAFLKTIEEPPKHLIFIFATTEVHKFPLTIVSRCQKFKLKNLTYYSLEKTINNIIEKENIKIEKNALKKLINLSDGSARDCLTFLNQLDTYTSSNIKLEDVNQIFGLLDLEQKLILISNIVNYEYEKIIVSINEYEEKGINFYQLATDIIDILFDKLVYEKTKNASLLKTLSISNVGFVNINNQSIIHLIEIWQDCVNKMKINSSQKFYFELTCLSNSKIFENDASVVKNIENTITNVNKISSIQNVSQSTSENEFNKINLNDVITTKVYGKDNGQKNIDVVKIKNNPSENKSLEKLNEITKTIEYNKPKTTLIKHDEIQMLSSNEIDQILNQCIQVVNLTVEKSKNKTKQKKVDKTPDTNENPIDNDSENIIVSDYNLFNMFNEELNVESKINESTIDIEPKQIISSLERIEKLKNTSTTILKTETKNSINENEKQKIINEFKNNIKNSLTDDNMLNELSVEQKYDIFNAIASNSNNNEKVIICNKFNKLKGIVATSLEEGYISCAKKILIVSNNGIVVIFDNEINARNLNINNENTLFLKYICKKFGKVYYLLGLSEQEAKEFTNKYKEMIKNNKEKVIDVNIKHLNEKVNAKNSVKDLAMSMLNDYIEEESKE